MEGTIRTFDPDMRQYIHGAIERTARLIAESAGAEIELEIYQGPPAVQNNAELTSLIMPALERASGKPVLSIQPQTVAEDPIHHPPADCHQAVVRRWPGPGRVPVQTAVQGWVDARDPGVVELF